MSHRRPVVKQKTVSDSRKAIMKATQGLYDPTAEHLYQQPIFKTKNFDKFQGLVKDLINYLKQLLTADKDKQRVRQAQKKYLTMDKQQYLEYTLKNLGPYIDQIARHDETMFMMEVTIKPVNLLIGLDFRLVWRLNLDHLQKRTLFRYLLHMYMQASASIGQNRSKVKEIIDMLEQEKQIAQEAEENPNAFDDGDEGLTISDVFGEDSILVEMLQELQEEVDFKQIWSDIMGQGEQVEFGDNVMDTIGNIFKSPQAQEKIQEILKIVNQKAEEKSLTEEDIIGAIQTAQQNIARKMANSSNPAAAAMAGMMENFDVSQLMTQFKEGTGQLMVDGNGQPTPNMGELLQKLSQAPLMQQMMNQMQSELPAGQLASSTEKDVQLESSMPCSQQPLPNPFDLMRNPQFADQMRQMQSDPKFLEMMKNMQGQFGNSNKL